MRLKYRSILLKPGHDVGCGTNSQMILRVYLSRHRNMLVAEAFLKSLTKLYGRHMVYSDGGTWYPEACNSLGLKHILHSPFEKSIIKRSMEYVKDRTQKVLMIIILV